MDILDQLSSPKIPKAPKKNKTSILNSSAFPSDLDTIKSSLFKSNNENYSSHQQLKSSHFDLEANSKSINLDNNKSNFPSGKAFGYASGFSLSPSLGVIMSEDGSEASQSSSNSRQTIRRRQSNNLNENTYISPMAPITEEVSESKCKIVTLESKISELENKLSSSQQQLIEKEERIKELTFKYERALEKNSQERQKMMQDQEKALQIEQEKMNRKNEEEIRRKEQVWEWESKNKESLLNAEIESLKQINERYKILMESESELVKQKYKEQIQNEHEQREFTNNKLKCAHENTQIEIRTTKLEQKINEFYDEKRENDKKMQHIKKEIDEQKIRLKNEEIEMRRELRQREERLEIDIESKRKVVESKLRKIELDEQELKSMKELLESQKEENKKFHDKIMRENKISREKIAEEKERVYELESDLLRKIQVVEAVKSRPIQSASLPKKYVSYEIPEEAESINILNEQKENIDQKKTEMRLNASQNLLEKSKRSSPKKVNVGDYLLKLEKTQSLSKIGFRPIHRLQEFYS